MSIINLQKTKPRTPGTRWKRRIPGVKSNNNTPNQLQIVKKWSAGRSVMGKICSKHLKSKKSKLKITQLWPKRQHNSYFYIKSELFNFFKQKSYWLCETNKGGFFFLPSTSSIVAGRLFLPKNICGDLIKNFIGSPVLLSRIPFFFKICYVSVWPFYKYTYGLSSGAFCIKLRAPKREKNIKIKLPSGFFRFVPNDSLVISGASKQMWTHRIVVGKAGTNYSAGQKPIVRGIAMNSVDHPHGGKANSVQPERSPWGWITKASH